MPKMTVALLNETLNQQAEKIAALEAEVHTLKLTLEHFKKPAAPAPRPAVPKETVEYQGQQIAPKAFCARIAYRLRDIGYKAAYVEYLGEDSYEVRNVWSEPKGYTHEKLSKQITVIEDWAAKQAKKQAEKPQPAAEEEDAVELAYEG